MIIQGFTTYAKHSDFFNFFEIDRLFLAKTSLLFQSNRDGENLKNEMWESFNLWWWSQPLGGKIVLETVSGWGIEYIWEEIQQLFQERDAKGLSGHYFVIPLFKTPPATLSCDSDFFHLETAESFIPDTCSCTLDTPPGT